MFYILKYESGAGRNISVIASLLFMCCANKSVKFYTMLGTIAMFVYIPLSHFRYIQLIAQHKTPTRITNRQIFTLLLYERTEFPLLRFGLIAKQTIILPTAHEFTIGNLKPGKKLCNGFICFTELLSNWLKTLLYSIIARELNLWVHHRPRAQQMWWGVLNIVKRHF